LRASSNVCPCCTERVMSGSLSHKFRVTLSFFSAQERRFPHVRKCTHICGPSSLLNFHSRTLLCKEGSRRWAINGKRSEVFVSHDPISRLSVVHFSCLRTRTSTRRFSRSLRLCHSTRPHFRRNRVR
jgi:hypothetical protein